jgi:hypothetical protein
VGTLTIHRDAVEEGRQLGVSEHSGVELVDGDVDADAAAQSLEQRGGVRHGHVCCSVSTAHDVTS